MMLCGMGMASDCGMQCGINHASLALLLIALGVGAMVKYKSMKAASCQTGGKILGYFIMIVAALGLVCTAMCAYKSKSCHETKAKKECHDCDDKDKSKNKYHEGMQLPPGHPSVDSLKMPAPETK
jgi:hypothetical protein